MVSVRVMKSLLVLVLLSASFVSAAPMEVGSGVNKASLYIEWKDGFVAEFDIYFGLNSSDTINGGQLLDIVELNTNLETVRVYGANYLYSADFDGHYNAENWTPENQNDYWAYYTKEAENNYWGYAEVGMTSRVLHNGDSDGWIYGRAGEPIPEPMTISLLAFGGLFLRNRKV